jgi:3-oxoadipate enol-lactonase
MTLSYDEAGSGPTVVLLHSTVCDRRMWDPQMPALTDAGYRVVRCDLRGFGETPLPEKLFNNGQDVVDLLDALGVEQTALIGSSGGGRVALQVAGRWPQRVTSLALLCTALDGHEPSPELQAFSDQEDALLDAGDVAGATELNVGSWVGPEADEAVRDKVRVMQRHAFEVQLAAEDVEGIELFETDLSAITARSLLISGAHDFADFREIAVELSQRLPKARLVELDWAGHLPSIERPDVVNPILVDFLRVAS